LARGRLGRADASENTARAGVDEVAGTLYGPPTDPILGVVADVAAGRGVSPAQVALAWVVAQGIVPIAGVTKPGHLEDAVAASALELTVDEIARLDGAYTARPLAELPLNSKSIRDPREVTALLSQRPKV
jgi:aryl-alcohol dehydrogenase-like predicted oxidoreductase